MGCDDLQIHHFKKPPITWLLIKKERGRGAGSLNLPLPVSFHPGSRPISLGPRLFALFGLQNTMQCQVFFFSISSASRHLENPAYPPPSTPATFSPVSRPPSPSTKRMTEHLFRPK